MVSGSETERRDIGVVFGRRVLRIIGAKGLTRKTVACDSGLSINTLNYIINAKRYPTLYSIYRIRRALGCSWEDLLGE